MAGNESQSNKKIWFFVVTVLAVLALTGCFILYKYIQNNNKNSNNSKKNIVESSVLPSSNPDLDRKLKEVSKSNFGADMPRLGFADEKKVIIYDDNGIYIFNLVSGKLDGYFDFKQNGLGGLQGSNATFVYVSSDGNSIYIDSVDKRKFIYDVMEQSYEKAVFALGKIDLWEEEKGSQKQIETKKYISISNVYNDNKHKMFLALLKNDNMDYSSLAFVNSEDNKEKIYLLFKPGS